MVYNEYVEHDTYFIMKTNRHDVKIDKDDVHRCQLHKWRMCGDNGYVFAIINNTKHTCNRLFYAQMLPSIILTTIFTITEKKICAFPTKVKI